MRMPGVAEVAVVAAPDPRLGELGCAFFRMQPGIDRAGPRSRCATHLEARGLARQKWPEDVREIDEFPRTPSGKIQKFVLRQRLRDEAATGVSKRRRSQTARRSPACGSSTSAASSPGRSHVLPRVDGRRGDRGRVARAVDEPAPAAVRRTRTAAHAPTTSTARCRSRSSSGPRQAQRRARHPAARGSGARAPARRAAPTCSSRTRGRGRCASSASATSSCARAHPRLVTARSRATASRRATGPRWTTSCRRRRA